MSYLDEIKKQDSSGRPTLNYKRVDVREDETTGALSFSWYNKETKKSESIESIVGAKLGNCMSTEVYDDSIKKSWYSNYVFDTSNENTMIFDPIKKGKAFDKPINFQDAKNWLLTHVGGTVKSFYTIWVYSVNDDCIYAVKTNSTIGIDQINKLENKIKDGHLITLTPKKYSADFKFSGKVKDGFLKFAAKNPPKFANVEIGEKITKDSPFIDGLDLAMDEFNAFKAGFVGVTSFENKEKPAEHHVDVEGLAKAPSKKGGVDVSDMISQPVTDDDDLPF